MVALLLTLVVVGLLNLSVLSVGAQTIHANPQKAAYASPAEWPFFSSQCHWKANNVLAHTHVELTAPVYSEWIGGTLKVPVQFQLFHTSGKIVQVWSELGWVNFTSINPPNHAYPNIQGDPNGVVVVQGIFTIDPTLGNTSGAGPFGFSPHGWTTVRLAARTQFPDGSGTETHLFISFFSKLDTSIAERPAPADSHALLRAQCVPFAAHDVNVSGWGAMITEFKDFVPIAPMALGTVFDPQVFQYSYGAIPGLQNATVDRRLDPDLHHGFDGIQVTSPFTFDSNFSGPGTHKFSFIWDKKVGDTPPAGVAPNQQASSLLVVQVTVGEEDGVPPPLPPPPPPPTLLEILLARLIAARTSNPFDGTLTFTQDELDFLIANLP
jgi:hypothetical protein